MSVTTRGRIVRGAGVTSMPATPRVEAGFAGRRIASAEIDARTRAREIILEAEARSRTIASEAATRAAAEARDAEQAKVAAHYLALRAAEERRVERDVDRTVELAVLLAERLLGRELDKDPELVAMLARQALAEARGARRARIECSPLDADVLRTHLATLGLPPDAVEIAPNSELSRGSLLLHTDLGTLDAKLAPQLDRLAAALRDVLRSA